MSRKFYSNKDLEKPVQEYMDGIKLKVLMVKFPHVPKRTITDRAKNKRRGTESENRTGANIIGGNGGLPERLDLFRCKLKVFLLRDIPY